MVWIDFVTRITVIVAVLVIFDGFNLLGTYKSTEAKVFGPDKEGGSQGGKNRRNKNAPGLSEHKNKHISKAAADAENKLKEERAGGVVPHVPQPKGIDVEVNRDSSLNELLIDIFGEYHKELVPKRPTVVKLDLLLIKVKSTNEREGIFESVVALFIEWQDRRLTWIPSQYDNTTVLAFDSDKVWLPDIAMTNSADHLYSISKDTRFVVRVSHDGSMKFVPTGTARTWCDLRLLTFPFDIQTCSFEFESWSLDSSTMTFNSTSNALVDDAFASPQWALCTHRSTVYEYFYEFSGEVFTRVRFDFVVRRKSTFYIINLIFPCATLSMIQLLVFIIPSTDATSDRVAFGTTNLLTLVVFQTIITEEMPKSSDSVTALSKYIIALIIISAIGILESVLAERLLRPTTAAPPAWIVRMRLPLLWDSQLPGGTASLMVNSWAGQRVLKGDPNNRPSFFDADDVSDCGCGGPRRRQGTRRAPLAPPVSFNLAPAIKKLSPSTISSGNISIEEFPEINPSTCVPTRKNPPNQRSNSSNSNRSASKSLKKQASTVSTNTNGSTNKTSRAARPSLLTIRHQDAFDSDYANLPGGYMEPQNRPQVIAPIFRSSKVNYYTNLYGRASSPLLRSSPQSPRSRMSTKNLDSFFGVSIPTGFSMLAMSTAANKQKGGGAGAQDVEASLASPSPSVDDSTRGEAALIEIGKNWGAIVTRLDGLTFVICASLAIFLPVLLFLPLALTEQKCSQ